MNIFTFTFYLLQSGSSIWLSKQYLVMKIILFFVTLYLSVSLTEAEYPKGWFDSSFWDLGCLYFKTESMPLQQAAEFCWQHEDSHLIQIDSQDQNQMDFLLEKLDVRGNCLFSIG